ncbi:uncharacterized protein [Euwallacea fornicatus]|uniref:uncharacterized protein n=1 Tax=Euwallacea fornicatus TaxID=995702 RepID=UPI00338EE6EB
MSAHTSSLINGHLNGSIEVSNGSVSWESNEFFFESDRQCSKWVIYVFLLLFFFGSCVILLICCIILCSKKNGVLSIILQLTIADIVLFPVAIAELISSYYQTWKLDSHICVLHKGTEIFANSLVIYLLICLNFHVITFWNLHNLELIKNNKNPLTSFNESSSSECLVTSSEFRAINYQKRKSDVPVLFPVIFVWTLCLSLSMPNYVLSTTVEVNDQVLCLIVQNDYGKILHSLLLMFCMGIPCIILLSSVLILIYKVIKDPHSEVLTKQNEKTKSLLIACIVLSIAYMVTSYQRHYLSLVVTIKEFFISENHYYNTYFNVYLVMLHYCGNILRGLMYYLVVPDVRHVVNGKLTFRST